MTATRSDLYTYEQWLENSLRLFREDIKLSSDEIADAKDHKLANTKNQQIFKIFSSLQSAWSTWHKSAKMQDLVTIVRKDILTITPLKPSSLILVCRVKACLDGVHFILGNLSTSKEAKMSAHWFYDLLSQPMLKIKLLEVIQLLDSQIKMVTDHEINPALVLKPL